MSARGGRRRNVLAWTGGGVLVLAAAGLTALMVVVLFAGSDDEPQTVTPSPSLNRPLTLLAEPHEGAEAVASVSEGVPVVVVGRSDDGRWLSLAIAGRSGVEGWAPVGAVSDAGDVNALAVVGQAGTTPATPSSTTATTPTMTPDLPDLMIDAVFSRDNRLVVVVVNAGDTDIAGPISVSVDGGEPVRIDVEGKPLRPGDTLRTALEGEYVQRRAGVTLEVFAEGIEERDSENNRAEAVIAPDVPNDLELLSAEIDAGDGHLIATVRNNSVIPVVGEVTIAVRETQPSSQLLGRVVEPLAVAAGGTQRYDFPDLTGLDLSRIQVILSPDAVNDANGANDVFPR